MRVGIDISPGRTRGPAYRRVGKGLYVPNSVDRRAEQRIVEAAARLPHGGAVTGWAALRLAGASFFDGLAADGRTELPVPLALQPYQRLKPTACTQQIRGSICEHDRSERHGIACTSAERAILDAIRPCHGVRDAVSVIDMALVGRTTTHDRIAGYESGHCHRWGIRKLREAVPLAVARSRSPKETEMRLIWILDAGLPEPLCNWPIHDADGTYLGAPDLLAPDLGVYGEFDGADHRSRERHRIDVERTEAFRDVGLEGFTLVGADLDDRRLVVARMRSAVKRASLKSRGTWRIPDEAPTI